MLIGTLQTPKVVIPSFNGDPMGYICFIRAFEHNIEWVIMENTSRMAHLAQLCTGKAAHVIECCLLMPLELGYLQARELLRDVIICFHSGHVGQAACRGEGFCLWRSTQISFMHATVPS